jgi:predicted dehydrogenase
MTNLGAHSIDIMQWYMQVAGPSAVSSSGGRFVLEDGGETPDTQDALFEYPGFTAMWSHREMGVGRRGPGLEFVGSKGSMTVSREAFEVVPDMKIDPRNTIPTFQGHPSGGPERTRSKPEPWTAALKGTGSSQQQFDLHVRNFLDCIKSRQKPIADVEDGHHTAVACHLANISLRTGSKIRWDAEREEIIGNPEAARMLARSYRKPWDSVLRSFKL